MPGAALFTSASDEWETPQELFDELNGKFGFQLDVCASEANAKCRDFYTKAQDGIAQPWSARNWMNPPYGRQLTAWCAKADDEAKRGKITVALLPARTDTRWYHEYCSRWHRNFLRGRLRFESGGKKTNSAPFPSMIVYFGIPT